MKTNAQLYTALFLSVLLLGACSNKNDYSAADQSSVTDQSLQYFKCNNINSPAFSGQAQVYFDQSGRFVSDAIRVNLDSLASNFTNDASVNLEFLVWGIPISGQTTQSQPLYFHFETRDQFHVPVSGEMTSVNNSTISALISQATSISASSVIDFFGKTSIVVTGVSQQYQVLHPELYSGSSVVASTDLLIPYFYADPNQYAANGRDLTLDQLHPFWSQRNLGYNFQQIAQQMCN